MRGSLIFAMLAAILCIANLKAEPVVCKGQAGAVLTVALSPDGKTVVSGGIDRMVRVWSVADGKQLLDLPIYGAAEQNPGVCSVAVSPDGKTLAVAAWEKPVTFWDLMTGAQRDIPLIADQPIGEQMAWGLAFSPDGSKLGIASHTGLTLLDLAKKKSVFHVPLSEWFQPRQVVFSPDGSLLATNSGRVFKLLTEKEFINDRSMSSNWVTFSPDGTLLIAATSAGGYPKFAEWNLQEKKEVLQHSGEQPGTLFCVAVSPDGKIIATGGGPDPTVRLWDRTTSRPLGFLKGHTDAVKCLCFSGDGKVLVSAGYDKLVFIWTLETDLTKADAN